MISAQTAYSMLRTARDSTDFRGPGDPPIGGKNWEEHNEALRTVDDLLADMKKDLI